MQIDYAYSLCKEFTIRHYENFPVGSFLIPADKRKYIYSIYSFARYSDDIADSVEFSETEKLQKLNELESELFKIYKKDSDLKDTLITDTEFIFTALSHTVNELKIPFEEFVKLLNAFRQDSVRQSYSDFSELLEYSDLSANPIGHLVLYVFGYDPVKNKECFEYSNKICTALQLTNFWQDVSVDLKMKKSLYTGKYYERK
ncbi:MAG: squalene/phytoene synthase family protein [Ignavibacteria bacterium]